MWNNFNILNYSLLLLIQFEKYKIEKLFRRALSKESFSFFFFQDTHEIRGSS